MIKFEKILCRNLEISNLVHSYSYVNAEFNNLEEKYLYRLAPNYFTQLVFELEDGINKLESNGYLKDITQGSHFKISHFNYIDVYRKSIKKAKVRHVKVNLYPHAIFRIFNISPIEIKDDLNFNIKDVITRSEYDILFEQLYFSKDIFEKIMIIEIFLLNKLKSSKKSINFNYVEEALNSNFNINLKELSFNLGFSQRWLQKNIKEATGANLKLIISNKRFLKAISLINRNLINNTNISLTLISYECNYYDQAHFIKEFKRFMGMTPLEYIRSFNDKKDNYILTLQSFNTLIDVFNKD
ncbi:helix-turn-helix domain-containing protein [Malaciobacter canalis]|nr:AraC family transcriptional regulator [Malaciobacter canalis]